MKLNGSAVCADKLEKQEILTFFVQDAHKFTTLLLGNRNSCSMLGFTRILISKVESYRWMGLIIFRVTGMSSRTKRSFITLNVTTYCEFKQFQYFCLIFAIYGLRAYWLIFFTYLHTTWFFIFFFVTSQVDWYWFENLLILLKISYFGINFVVFNTFIWFIAYNSYRSTVIHKLVKMSI